MKHLVAVVLLALSTHCLAKDFGLTDVPEVTMEKQATGMCDLDSHTDANGNAC